MAIGNGQIGNSNPKTVETAFPVWFLKSHLNRALAIGLSLGFFWGFGEALFMASPHLGHSYLLGEMVTFIVASSIIHALLGALVMIIFAPFIYIFYRLAGSHFKLIDPVAFYISLFIFSLAFIMQQWQVEQLVTSTSLWGILAHIEVFIFSLAIAWACYRFIKWILVRRLAQVLVSDLILAAMALLSFLASRRLFFLVEEKLPMFHGFVGFLFALLVALAAVALGLVLFRRVANPNRLLQPTSILVILGIVIMLIALVLLWFVPAPRYDVQRPNIVLITLDTVRADDIGAYNPQRQCSPNLDRFAGESITFQRAESVAPITVPSHTSMLTGKYPSSLGIWQNGDYLADDVPALAEILRQNGYQTAAFVSSIVLESCDTGFSRGFDVYDDNFSPLGLPDELNRTLLLTLTRKWLHWDPLQAEKRLSENTVDRSLQWLGNQRSPVFLWVHLFDAHQPYDAPRVDRFRFVDPGYQGVFKGLPEQSRLVMYQELPVSPEDVKYMHQMYQGEIYYQDKQLGRLLNVLAEEPWQSRTMILVCADHGEGFEKNYYFNHVDRLWQPLIHVPMILHLPNAEYGGTRNYDLVSPLDFFDTALAFAGLTIPPDAPGTVLLDLINSGKTPQQRFLFSFCRSSSHPTSEGHARSIVDAENYKLIWHPYFDQKELYNLNNDPNETTDLTASDPARAKQLFDQLFAFFGNSQPQKDSEEVGSAQNEALKGLGYIGN